VSRRAAAAAVTGTLLLAGAAAPEARGQRVDAASVQSSPCYGAASRDPLRPCRDPRLRLAVVPGPTEALLAPTAPCGDEAPVGTLQPCVFGTRREHASGRVALIGDSHAGAWRAGLRAAAQLARWNAVNLTMAGCPFTFARLDLPGTVRARCARRNREAVAYLRARPEIHSVFVAGRAGAPVHRGRFRTPFAALAAGTARALAALPPSVRTVYVLRDPPVRKLRTLDCVYAAIAARRGAGRACAVPRRVVLRPDPSVAAARRTARRSVAIDLSAFFCSRRLCPPVIGGALVHKDEGHITTAFSRTLGPYLLRAVVAAERRSTARTS